MSYCSSLKDFQVKNVLCDEAKRMKLHRGGEIGKAARELYQEAREELLRRGYEPDDVLVDNGIRKP